MREYRYTYELRGSRFYIYDGGNKIAEISAYGDEAREIANNMVRALNARDRWLEQTRRAVQ